MGYSEYTYHIGVSAMPTSIRFRVICDIQDGALRVLVVQLGNRREVYT